MRLRGTLWLEISKGLWPQASGGLRSRAEGLGFRV